MHKVTILNKPKQPRGAKLPLYSSKISAGFPSPADDYIEDTIDLNDLLIKNKPATYLVRVTGNSMIEAAICDGDILVVDASKKARHANIVVASVDGEFLVKRLWIDKGTTYLKADNADFAPIKIDPTDELAILGVVTGVVREVK